MNGQTDRETRIAIRIADDLTKAPIKNRMPTERNLGTRPHKDKSKFQKSDRKEHKNELRRYRDD